jgi:hypothetical protein
MYSHVAVRVKKTGGQWNKRFLQSEYLNVTAFYIRQYVKILWNT